MKKLLILILTIACFSTSWAQNEDPNAANRAQGTFYPWSNSSGEENALVECYTLVSDANIREKPNATATVISKLPIATKVKIEQVTSDTLAINGFPAPWCKVSYMQQSKKMTGYIWGGTLAFAALVSKDDFADDALNGIVYLVGMSKFDEKNHNVVLQVRVAKNGAEIAKTEFKTTGDVGFFIDMERFYDNGLKNVKDVLMIKSYYPACGYGSGENLVFFTGKTLNRVLETSNMADGGAFYAKEDVLLPQEKGGITGHILVSSDTVEMTEKEVQKDVFEMFISKQDYKMTLYKWNGEKLVKLKEMK
jgi:hypothetical protein